MWSWKRVQRMFRRRAVRETLPSPKSFDELVELAKHEQQHATTQTPAQEPPLCDGPACRRWHERGPRNTALLHLVGCALWMSSVATGILSIKHLAQQGVVDPTFSLPIAGIVLAVLGALIGFLGVAISCERWYNEEVSWGTHKAGTDMPAAGFVLSGLIGLNFPIVLIHGIVVEIHRLVRRTSRAFNGAPRTPDASVLTQPTQRIPQYLAAVIAREKTSLIGDGSEIHTLRSRAQEELDRLRAALERVHASIRERGELPHLLAARAHAHAALGTLETSIARLDAHRAKLTAFFAECRAACEALAPWLRDLEVIEAIDRAVESSDRIASDVETIILTSTHAVLARLDTVRALLAEATTGTGARLATAAMRVGGDSVGTLESTIDAVIRATPDSALDRAREQEIATLSAAPSLRA